MGLTHEKERGGTVSVMGKHLTLCSLKLDVGVIGTTFWNDLLAAVR